MITDSELIETPDSVIRANGIKNLTVNQLVINGKISQEDADDFCSRWQIILVKKSWFKKWFDKFGKGEREEYMYIMVNFEG